MNAISRALLAMVVASGAFAPVRAQDEEEIRLQRHFHYLYLGDTLEDIQRVYAPAQEWPAYREPRNHVNRIRIERTFLKRPDRHVDVMWLGMKRNRLVELQLIYDASYTREKSVEQLAKELSLIYGEPRSQDGKYWWADGKTVIRVFHARVPVNNEDGTRGVELRTSLQLAEDFLFKRRG